MAASLLAGGLLLLSGYLALQLAEQHTLNERLLGPQNTIILALTPERGTTEEPSARLVLPQAPKWIVLRLEIEPTELEAYRVSILDEESHHILELSDARPDAIDVLNLSIHSSKLQPGDYTIRVLSADPGDSSPTLGAFALRILPKR